MEAQDEVQQRRPLLLMHIKDKAASYHDRIPLLRRVPLRSIAVIAFVAFINAIIWAASGIVLVSS